jgi:hypothetical protein
VERRAAGTTTREGRSLSARPPLPKPLAALAQLRQLSAEEVRRRFDVGPEGTEKGVQYRHEDGVTALHNGERLPGTHFFFRDGALVAIYVAAGLVLDGIRPAELTAELGEPAAVLPSRTGPGNLHRVYPDHGVAFADAGSALAALELFPPTTLQDYLQRLWVDPGPHPIR